VNIDTILSLYGSRSTTTTLRDVNNAKAFHLVPTGYRIPTCTYSREVVVYALGVGWWPW